MVHLLRSVFHGSSPTLCPCRKTSFLDSHSRGQSVRSFVVCASSATSKAAEDYEAYQNQFSEDDRRESGGVKFEGVVERSGSKSRLDQWLSKQLPRVSRARVQSSIRHGLALVNGQPANKVSFSLKGGDTVECKLIGPTPSEAEPEDIALDIAFEDEHVIVINKPAHMVVHPAPGHSKGTLVNALLHHCGLPAMQLVTGSSGSQKGLLGVQDSEEEDELPEDDEAVDPGTLHKVEWSGPAPIIRPGIVHRLDKGTSGLLVVAKDDYTHEHLCNQFKARTVRRSYLSLTCGSPPPGIGRVDVPIGRDPRDRKRMAAFPFASPNMRTRPAASKYRVLEVLAQGGSSLLEWRLETGRTHQIRVHAQHLGYPLLGDEAYGGTKGAAEAKLLPKFPSVKHGPLRHMVAQIDRPCLHAQTLGFLHPWTGEELNFMCPPPEDFATILQLLRLYGTSKV
ncbi:23S rRNA pseudouridine1911/1915/1917 synthase [Marchantia polymorpha subsp. ruderalis]|uniref:RNA-binding S4 domain-containing protein n=2 Tax=Marchantia polymorpha TaxID=3197 RepID=A0AAF6BHR4_MARPO|nr:hypothetical protein MARPO_0092s0023 [Marchantia polymorpha]BBN11548.1 hypothetical protein Mp_5g12850 [Marchantia polymorpha subsp. ruderalis]|eukprot:PTQ33052.1 hypothetical protein MARPO_0092s0023 [Marchantia polymorpha]